MIDPCIDEYFALGNKTIAFIETDDTHLGVQKDLPVPGFCRLRYGGGQQAGAYAVAAESF